MSKKWIIKREFNPLTVLFAFIATVATVITLILYVRWERPVPPPREYPSTIYDQQGKPQSDDYSLDSTQNDTSSTPPLLTQTYPPEEIRVRFEMGSNSYLIDGLTHTTDVAPQIVRGRTMVPLRVIAEAFGARVELSDETGAIMIYRPVGDKYVRLPIALTNYEIVGGRIKVPLRYMAYFLGARIEGHRNPNFVYVVGFPLD